MRKHEADLRQIAQIAKKALSPLYQSKVAAVAPTEPAARNPKQEMGEKHDRNNNNHD